MISCLTPATEQHLWLFARELGAADDAEAQGNGWASAFEAYSTFLAGSVEAWAGVVDRRVACLFGVRERDGMAVMWFHSAPLFVEKGRRLLRPARDVFAGLSSRWPALHCYVSPTNAQLVKLARWVGFEVYAPVPMGMRAQTFHHAVLRRPRCVQDSRTAQPM